LGLFAGVVALLLPTAYTPVVEAASWTPKAALIPVIAAVGAPLLLGRASPGIRNATWALRLLIVVGAIATARSARPLLGVYGHYGFGTGLVFILAVAGAWAIGTRLSEGDRQLLGRAVGAAIAVNAALILAEMPFDLRRYGFGRLEGRAPGLMGNPVYVGPILAVGVILVVGPLAVALGRRDLRRGLVVGLAIAATAAAMSLAGSRTALVLCIFATAWAWRTRGRVVAAVAAVTIAVGWLGAPLLDRPPQPTHAAAADASSTSAPAAADSPSATTAPLRSGITATINAERRPLSPRLATWWSARHAFFDHPIVGAGPGQFNSATVRYRPRLIEVDTPGKYFLDAHNLVIEYAVTTGAVGLSALLAWLLYAFRLARGPFAVAAAAMFLALLVEPQHVTLSPLAALMLGAAGSERIRTTRHAAIAIGATGLVGLVAASALLYGDFSLHQAVLDYRFGPARVAEQVLRPWVQPPTQLAAIYTFHGSIGGSSDNPAALRADAQARRWLAIAAERDPSNVPGWLLLAQFEYAHGAADDAERHFGRALRVDRWSSAAMEGLGLIEYHKGNLVNARRWFDAAHSLDPTLSDGNTRVQRLEELRDRAATANRGPSTSPAP
jgi:O-antigen ligase